MRAISIKDFLAISGMKRATFDARQTEGEIALGFGLARRLAGGTMLDIDVICTRIGGALTPAFGRKHAATIVAAYSDEILKAIGLADSDASEDMFLCAAEFDWQIARDHRMVFGATTLPALAKSYTAAGMATTRATLINVTQIMHEARVSAAEHGLDWSAPFFPPPGDPMADKLIATAKQERALAVEMAEGAAG